VRVLAGDVGGTKTLVGLFDERDGAVALLHERSYPSARHDSLAEIAHAFLSEHGAPHVDAACFAAAGPVIDGAVNLTNLHWKVSTDELRESLGVERMALLNDLEATAFGMLQLDDDDFAVLQSGDPPDRRGHIAVVAAGTGLGEAVLHWDGEHYHPAATEGGHGGFAPRDEREIGLLRFLQRELDARVSVERVVSGPGLHAVYRYLRAERGGAEPEALARRMAEGDPSAIVAQAGMAGEDGVCAEALELFLRSYGSETGDVVLRHLALGGVLLGGGIAPKILPALRRGPFLDAMADKGRFSDLLRSVRVSVALVPETALLGAAHYALRLPAG
jgi:glucokinase